MVFFEGSDVREFVGVSVAVAIRKLRFRLRQGGIPNSRSEISKPAAREKVIASLPPAVNIPAIADPQNGDSDNPVFNLIDHPEVADPDASQRFRPRQLFTPVRPWRRRQLVDRSSDALPIPQIHRRQVFLGRLLEDNQIRCHRRLRAAKPTEIDRYKPSRFFTSSHGVVPGSFNAARAAFTSCASSRRCSNSRSSIEMIAAARFPLLESTIL